MSYEVRCECGKAHPVTAGDAGASIRCECGRTVEVPELHELRAAAGEEAVSPVVQLQTLLLAGQLPGTRSCARCGAETDGLVRVSIQCERAIVKSAVGQHERLAGCLLFGLLGYLFADLMFFRQRHVIEQGQDVEITAPVRVCQTCASELTTSETIRQSLRKTPEYAALLDKYPNARITRRG